MTIIRKYSKQLASPVQALFKINTPDATIYADAFTSFQIYYMTHDVNTQNGIEFFNETIISSFLALLNLENDQDLCQLLLNKVTQ